MAVAATQLAMPQPSEVRLVESSKHTDTLFARNSWQPTADSMVPLALTSVVPITVSARR